VTIVWAERAECDATERIIVFDITCDSEEKDAAAGGTVEAWESGKLGGEGLENVVNAVG